MTIPKPDLVARVHFLSAAEGGRTTPTPSNAFGCTFELAGERYDCRLLLESVGSIAPGRQATVPIKVLSRGLLKGLLKVGQTFDLHEGGTRIAEGEIEQVLA
jgi:translation elongation factor EF-Tu-like GTPase